MKPSAVVLLALALLSPLALGQELQLREKVWTEVRYLYDRSDFDALEAMYQKLADPAERFPSGMPKLTEFYGVFQCGCSVGGARLELDAMQTVEARALEWRKRYPSSNGAQIALAYVYNDIGTLYRGTGLANTVNPADWKKWREYGEKAYRVLMERGEAPRADPQWYGAMFVTLLRYQTDTEEFPRLFQEGMRRHPSYPELYFAAAYHDSPMWMGSVADMESVAQAAVRASAATEGKSMYARIYWYLDSLPNFNGRVFTETFARWTVFRDSFEDLVQRYPDPWNLNRYAYFACSVGDRATYSDVIKRVGSRVDYGAWNTYGSLNGKFVFDRCANGMGYAVGLREAAQVTSFEDLPEPRRTLNYMVGGMERRIGVFAYFTLVLAFVLGFALRSVGLHWTVAWAIATLQAPLAVALPFLQTGRSGYVMWAFAGAATLGLVLAGLGVGLAHVFVRRRTA